MGQKPIDGWLRSRDKKDEEKVFFLGAGASCDAVIPGVKSYDLIQSAILRNALFSEHVIIEGKVKKKAIKFLKRCFSWNEERGSLPAFEDIFSIIDGAISRREGLTADYPNSKLYNIRDAFVYLFLKALNDLTIQEPRYLSTFIDNESEYRSDGKPSLVVITTNWDILLDQVMMTKRDNGKCETWLDYGIEFNSLDYTWMQRPEECSYIELLKLNGSGNWLYCSTCRKPFTTKDTKEPVIWNMLNMVQGGTVRKCPSCGAALQSALIDPTFYKYYAAPLMGEIWNKAYKRLAEAKEWYFIGYSLPMADLDIKYMLKKAFLSGSRQHKPRIIVVGKGKKGGIETPYKEFFGHVDEVCSGGFKKWVATRKKENAMRPM